MTTSFKNIFWLIWKLIVISFFLTPFIGKSYGLDELFNDYDSPQALAMGKAFTADATGHVANYYNPAGLAKEFRRSSEIIPVALDVVLGGTAFGALVGPKTTGLSRQYAYAQAHPGQYGYSRYNWTTAFARRGFAVSLLGSYWYAGRSTGEVLETDSGYDVGGTIGYGFNAAGNTLKFGVSARALLRNQLKGFYEHTALVDKATTNRLMKEGYGVGVNVGMLLTLPFKYLPTFGVVVKDAFDTTFTHTTILNQSSTEAPDPILRSINAAISVHPILWRGWKSTFAVEFKHIELVEHAWQKKLHVGMQIENERNLYLWLGANQLYLTAGFGWRVKGGDLEIGTYGEDIGDGEVRTGNRRMYLRYTIDF